jgi:hypothetical protein
MPDKTTFTLYLSSCFRIVCFDYYVNKKILRFTLLPGQPKRFVFLDKQSSLTREGVRRKSSYVIYEKHE